MQNVIVDYTTSTATNRPSSSSPPGYAGYKLCYYEVMKVIKGIVHQPFEVKGSSVFYAFSYYFDRAVESGLIGERGEPCHSGRHTSVR